MIRDTRHLRSFYAVCLEGSFARAAKRLNCTQPAVSYQITALERDLGARLFERGGRRALLTSAGRRMLDFCRTFFAELDDIASSLGGGAEVSAEPLRVASVSGFGRYVLFPILCNVTSSAATTGRALQLDLRFRTAAEVFNQVEKGDVDLGVVYLPKVSNYLKFYPICDEELVLIASPSLAARTRRASDLGSVDSYDGVPFVTYLEGDYVFGRWFDAIFGAQPARTLSVHHFDELEEVIAAVQLGYGMSIIPFDSVRAAVAARKLRVIRPVRDRRCINQVFAVTRAGATVRAEIVEIISALKLDSSKAAN